jgi:hypothetical protein
MNFKDYFFKLYVGVGFCPSADTYPPETKVSLLDYDSLSVMFPINEETGHVVDLLTRLLNCTNELERNNIMQYLQDNSSASVFAKLDDDTKLKLLKPRSLQSLDELSEYGDMLKSAIEQFNASSDPASSDSAPSDPAPSDSAPSDPASSDPAPAS